MNTPPEHYEKMVRDEAFLHDLQRLRLDDVLVPMTAAQLALLAIAAQQALVQDPERCWLPSEFAPDLSRILSEIQALGASTFGPETALRLANQ